MIKIEIDAATGAEARLELLNLLGVGTSWVGIDPAKPGADVTAKITVENGEVTSVETNKEETAPAAEETTKKKRRTKAEIEAEEKAEIAISPENEPDTSQAPPGPVDAEQAAKDKEALEVKVPELVDLQRVCAILVRAGYKKEGVDFIKNIGGADSSKEVPEAKRQDVIDAMTAFATEKQITVA
jgi:hypothetical protein